MIRVHHMSLAQDASSISKEDEAAKLLKEKFIEDLSSYPNAKGDIYILTSIRIFGQKRNDIDMLVIGFLDDLIIKGVKTKNYGEVKELSIKSFVTNIELKSHPSNKVTRNGTDYVVTYGNNVKHNASQQCNEAKFSLYNHLVDQLNLKPFICDILWFNGLTRADLYNMHGSSYDNTLHRGFTFKEYINTILLQANVSKDESKQFYLDAFNNGKNEFETIIQLFTAKREPQGLTKAKFELLSQKSIDVDKIKQDVGSKLTIVTGRAGTGKTVQLLQLAFALASEEVGKRCLILTYNNALVSDIQRLIDYTPMPSKVDGRTVSIKTIDSFFQSLMHETGVLDKKLIPTNKSYSDDYQKYLKELYYYVTELCESKDISAIKDMPDSPFDWDVILIDEAQDFSDLEKGILFKIYGSSRMIVADGVDQFMRHGHRQIWERNIDKSLVRKQKEMELERRQKANLVTFVNAYAHEAQIDWKVKPNDNLPGGEIKIYKGYNSNIHTQLKDNCIRNGCENYDILILEPPTMVEHGDRICFKNADKYKKANINIYDGTNPNNRTSYPTKNECRLYQYHSCRGLEGWCVVCDKFDDLISYQLDHFTIPNDSLGLDDDVKKWRNVMLWSLMPLTRPIDTLIITLSDPTSKIGILLKKLANIYPDFIEWNID